MKMVKENVNGIDSYLLIITLPRGPARNIIITPNIILIEQFIQKHVQRTRWKDYSSVNTCIVNDKQNFTGIPNWGRVLKCLIYAFENLRNLDKLEFFLEADILKFGDLWARKFIQISNNSNPADQEIFRFKFLIRLVELLENREGVINRISDIGPKQKKAINDEFDKIAVLIGSKRKEKEKLEKERKNLNEEFDFNNDLIKENKSYISTHLTYIKDYAVRLKREKLENENKKMAAQNVSLNKKIINIDLEIRTKQQEIECLMTRNKFFSCRHIQPVNQTARLEDFAKYQ